MTAIKAKAESRVILDFSNREKCSKSHIRQALRQCEVINWKEDGNELVIYDNQIKIGMYTITLELPFDSADTWRQLKDYGDFQVIIDDGQIIDLKKDGRFSSQDWVSYNFFGKLRIKHLIEIIKRCSRLDKLRAFL